MTFKEICIVKTGALPKFFAWHLNYKIHDCSELHSIPFVAGKPRCFYHKTKDPYYVKNFLGHKSMKSSEIYMNIEHALFETGIDDDFTDRVTEKIEEIKKLLKVGFEYDCQEDI